mgnify:CR=1 FL=1
MRPNDLITGERYVLSAYGIVQFVALQEFTDYRSQIIIPRAAFIRFLPGRLRFDGSPGPAPFDSAIVVFGKLGGQP